MSIFSKELLVYFLCIACAISTTKVVAAVAQPAIASPSNADANRLSSEEMTFLRRKGRINMCVDPDWMPLEKIQDGKHIGMSADYIAILEKFIGIPIELTPTEDWLQSVAFARHRKCDIFSLAMPTAERLAYMKFTQAYLRIPLVVATRAREPFVADIAQIKGGPLGVVRGYAFGEILRDAYPELTMVDVDGVADGLDRTAKGELYGFVGTLATVGFALQNAYPELKIAGKFAQSWDLGVGVRNDEPLLFSAFEKAIDSVTAEEHQSILNRWISVKYVKEVDYTHLWQGLALLLVLLSLLLYRQRLLARHNRQLHDNQALLKTLIHAIPDLVWVKDIKGVYLTCNTRFEAFFGAKEAQIVGKSDVDFVDEDQARCFREHDKRAIDNGRPTLNEEWITFASDGSRALLETIKAPLLDARGKAVGVIGVGRDITERKQAEDELRESEMRFRKLFENTPAIAVQGYDQERRVIYWNQASAELYGYASDEALGRRFEDLIVPDKIRRQVVADITAWSKGGPEMPASELVLQRADASPVHVFSSHVMLRGPSGEAEMYCIDIDLTALKMAEDRLHTLSQAVEQSPVSVIITDADSRIEYVNRAFEQSSGYTSLEVMGKNPKMLSSERNSSARCLEVWQAIESGEGWTGELQSRRNNGQHVFESVHIAPVLDEQGSIRHYLWMKEDISLQKQQEEKILYQAHFDNLTNLPNRLLVLDRLSQMVKEARRDETQVAVLFLDLDDFKKINDSLGHETGDRLLRQAAERLRETVRYEDTVGRLGGDEFIVLLGRLSNPVDARRVAENLLEQFRSPFRIDSRELIVTSSVGIAVYPEDGYDPASLLRHADTAMYHAKAHGRNTYRFFTSSMNLAASRRLELEEQLHGALARGELQLHYQPLVAIDSGGMTGTEALLRWSNPYLGEVSPDEFIPIAEQTGLIAPIGQYVLSEALAATARWQQTTGPEFKISVNLSPRQFGNPDLLRHLQASLETSGVSASALELEITEGVLMGAHAHIDETLQTLSELGIGIAMDDFGTGYSSLSYLRRYPFSTLKIDRSFIRDIPQDSADSELVNATIAMARSLSLKVVAEGVETEQQLAHLTKQGCDYAQGYLFSKPVSYERMSAMLENRQGSRLSEGLRGRC